MFKRQKEAEVIAITRKKGRLPSSQNSFFIKIICPNCNYVEVPVTHEDCINRGHIVIGRLLYQGKHVFCEICREYIDRNDTVNKTCKKCGYKFIAGFIEVNLPI